MFHLFTTGSLKGGWGVLFNLTFTLGVDCQIQDGAESR